MYNEREKNTFEMHLADEHFEKIKSGEKTVEIRLFDEKRKNIKVGDCIVFCRGDGRDECVSTTVVALHRFKSFQELFSSELFHKIGFGDMTYEEAATIMYKYYTQSQEQKYGVLGIEINRVGL